MLITLARIKNYKRVLDVEIRPEADRHLLLLAGSNMSGKTSVMDAIASVIGGKRAMAEDPVRHGTDEAMVELEWDNGLRATRTIEPDGTTKLEVSDSTQTVRSPQAVLDKLLGQRMLDPLAFVRLDGPARRLKLLEIIDTEKQIPAMDAHRQRIYDARTEVGRKVKDAEGEFHRLPLEAKVDPLIDVAELARELAGLTGMQRTGLEMAAARDRIKLAHDSARRELDAGVIRIRELEKALELERARQVKISDGMNDLARELAVRDEAVTASAEQWARVAPRRAEIDAELARADANNRAAVEAEQLNKRRDAAEATVRERQEQYAAQSEMLDKIDAKKLAFLAAAKLPVPGLGLADGDITFNGVPLAQASGAEKLRIALGISIASQSEIKDILIRDAALLDDDSLRMVDEVVTASGCRAWLERVGTRDPGAIVLQGGTVVE